jgi:hypothetical protein
MAFFRVRVVSSVSVHRGGCLAVVTGKAVPGRCVERDGVREGLTGRYSVAERVGALQGDVSRQRDMFRHSFLGESEIYI